MFIWYRFQIFEDFLQKIEKKNRKAWTICFCYFLFKFIIFLNKLYFFLVKILRLPSFFTRNVQIFWRTSIATIFRMKFYTYRFPIAYLFLRNNRPQSSGNERINECQTRDTHLYLAFLIAYCIFYLSINIKIITKSRGRGLHYKTDYACRLIILLILLLCRRSEAPPLLLPRHGRKVKTNSFRWGPNSGGGATWQSLMARVSENTPRIKNNNN